MGTEKGLGETFVFVYPRVHFRESRIAAAFHACLPCGWLSAQGSSRNVWEGSSFPVEGPRDNANGISPTVDRAHAPLPPSQDVRERRPVGRRN